MDLEDSLGALLCGVPDPMSCKSPWCLMYSEDAASVSPMPVICLHLSIDYKIGGISYTLTNECGDGLSSCLPPGAELSRADVSGPASQWTPTTFSPSPAPTARPTPAARMALLHVLEEAPHYPISVEVHITPRTH